MSALPTFGRGDGFEASDDLVGRALAPRITTKRLDQADLGAAAIDSIDRTSVQAEPPQLLLDLTKLPFAPGWGSARGRAAQLALNRPAEDHGQCAGMAAPELARR